MRSRLSAALVGIAVFLWSAAAFAACPAWMTLSGATCQSETFPASGIIVGTTDTQTLSGKTLTSPVISSITNTGTLTLPTATGTLMENALSSADLFVGNASNVATGVALSGDCTITNAGAITCTKTAGTSFGSLATLSTLPLSDIAAIGANTVLGNGTAASAAATALAMPSCSGASNALTWTTSTGFGCNTISGGGGTPTYFVGASAGAANAYTLAAPTPSSGWALTAGYTVSTTFPAANTGASTEAVAGGAALPIVAAQGNGLYALTGGEIAAGPNYLLTYSTNAATACGGSCYVLSPAGAQLVAFSANTTVTAYQWNAGDVFLATASGLTLTLPQASTVSKNIGIYLATGGNAVTLAPNALDGINGGAVNTAVSAPAHAGILITATGADGTGAVQAPGAGVVAAGTCTNCNETIDAAGRVTAFSNGSGGSGGGSFAIMGGMFPAPMSNAATSYCSLNGAAIVASNAAQCETTSEAAAEEIIAAPRQFGAIAGVSGSGFYVSGIPGTGASYTITLRVNGATPANGPMCTISSGQTSCSDTTHSASVAAGQTVDIMVAPTGTPSASTFSWAIDAQ